MPLPVPFRALPVLLCLSLSVIAAGISGCGGTIPPPGQSLPADAVYNSSVRSGGYTITDLGPGQVVGINNRGEVLGGTTHAYLWAGGNRHYLDVIGKNKGGSEAVSLNDSGQVLGVSYVEARTPHSSSARTTFVWQNGASTPVTVGSAPEYLTPVKINNAGQVLVNKNRYSADSESEYRLWKDGQSTPVDAVGKNGRQMSMLTMSDNGTLLGGASDSPEQFLETPVPYRAYLVKDGQVTDIGQNTYPGLINDRDQIVGFASADSPDDPDSPSQTFVWQNGTITTLTGLNRGFSPKDLSNTGQIVGYVHDDTTAYRSACRYDLNTQTMVDLDATVGKGAGWHLVSAEAINDAGQIIGQGVHDGKQRSFLLTPLP